MFEGVPLFLSRRTLAAVRGHRVAVTRFALDSGGFSELQMHGRWILSEEAYVSEVEALRRIHGPKLDWVAPQDWMCEPIIIGGGRAARGVVFAGTGLSVEEHQRRTVANFLRLRRALGAIVIPVLQGWTLGDYWRCLDMYERAGVRLAEEQTVGVGSVCRRQGTAEASALFASLAAEGLRLHGFGVKTLGLRGYGHLLASADSTAWSDTARRKKILLEGHDRPGDGRRTGHQNCANCAQYALEWRGDLIASLGARHAA